MIKWVRFAVGTFAAAAGVLVVTNYVRNAEVRRLAAQVDQLQQDRQRLLEYARRLSASRRVAQIDVLEQFADDSGRTVSTIQWQEIAPDGTLGPPQYVQPLGDLVYFEAAVIKFDDELVGGGDPQRGTSLALFRRIFGDQQPSAAVKPLDTIEVQPSVDERPADSLEPRLWALFWRMMDDPAMAAQYGVRVVQCEAPAVVLRAGQIWEITLDADGGLNLRIIGRRPAKPEVKPQDSSASTS